MRSQECRDCMCVHARTHTDKTVHGKSVSDSHFWTEQLILALLEKQCVLFYWYHCADI